MRYLLYIPFLILMAATYSRLVANYHENNKKYRSTASAEEAKNKKYYWPKDLGR